MTKLTTFNQMVIDTSGSTSGYDQAELRGRSLFHTIIKKNKDISKISYVQINDENKYTKYDGILLSGDTKIVFEIKYRPDMHSANNEWWIDEEKITTLKGFQNLHPEYKFMIAVVTKDKKLLMWDINDHQEQPKYAWVRLNSFGPEKGYKWVNVFSINKLTGNIE